MLIEPVVVLIPVLNRPHRVATMIQDVAASLSTPYRLLFVVDHRDGPELRALRREDADHVVVDFRRRSYARKINDGIVNSTEPLIFTAADDLHFHSGWLEAACALLSDKIDVVGTNDLLNPRVMAGEHSTHTLVRRSYVKQFGTVERRGQLLYEGYPHEYCDDELVGTAKMRGRFASATGSIVEHLHPYNGGAPIDGTYRKGWSGRTVGQRLIERRRHLWENPSPSA